MVDESLRIIQQGTKQWAFLTLARREEENQWLATSLGADVKLAAPAASAPP